MTQAYGQVGIRVVDERGEVTSVPFYFNIVDTTTLAQLLAAVDDLHEKVLGVSDSAMPKATVTLNVPLTNSQSAGTGSSIERTVLLKYLAEDGYVRHYGVDVPSPKLSIFYAGTKSVNGSDTDVLALSNLLLETTGMLYTNPTGVRLEQLIDGRMTFRKHRRVANRS